MSHAEKSNSLGELVIFYNLPLLSLAYPLNVCIYIADRKSIAESGAENVIKKSLGLIISAQRPSISSFTFM